MKALQQGHGHLFRTRIGVICSSSLLQEALDQRLIPLDSNAHASLLQQCGNINALKQIHAHIFRSGLNQNIFLRTKLVSMYAMYGNLETARLLFDKISKRDVFLWNVMIRGYAIKGPCEEALTLYYQMQQAGIQPDNFTFPFVLKACAALSAVQQGKEIHDHAVRIGFESDVFVRNSLIAMYARCGSLDFARQVFDKMSKRTVVSWNAIISGYVQNGHAGEALTLFNQMQLTEVKPNLTTMKSVLPACGHLADLQQGKWIHESIIKSGFESDVAVETALVDMYAKCGKMEIARQLFDKMSKRDVVLWSAMIAGYAQSGHADEALTLFHQMQLADVIPDSVTMLSVLPACAHLAALQQVMRAWWTRAASILTA